MLYTISNKILSEGLFSPSTFSERNKIWFVEQSQVFLGGGRRGVKCTKIGGKVGKKERTRRTSRSERPCWVIRDGEWAEIKIWEGRQRLNDLCMCISGGEGSQGAYPPPFPPHRF